MALKQVQELKQTQRLSPLQMQVIKMIELNTVEMEDRVKQEISDNPALEESDLLTSSTDAEDTQSDEISEGELSQEEFALGDYYSEDDIPDYHPYIQGESKMTLAEYRYVDTSTLNESLQEQIGLRKLDDRKKTIAEYIIGNLDENGYLMRNIQSIAEDILFQNGLEVSSLEMEDILYTIQELDPPGVGARNLQECLLLQLQRLEPSPIVKLAEIILSDDYDAFIYKHYEKIIRHFEITTDDLRNAIGLIVSLNPKPGSSLDNSMEASMNDITPDFIVESDNNEVTLYLNNRNIPELRINRSFSEMMEGYNRNKESMKADDKLAMLFMKQKVDSAKWFIDAVKQRQNTLYETMKAIIEIQYEFFITGDETSLKPMILKDVAEQTGFDISTISRVSNSKYVQTNNGVYPLKFFFSEAMQNSAGEDVSSREIKVILKESIENEKSSKPLTDEQLTIILNEKGYKIARRTVAKYREQLNIPVARLRKKI